MQHPRSMKFLFLSRASILLLAFLCAATAIACMWASVIPDTAYNSTLCVGAYPSDSLTRLSLSQWELPAWRPITHDWTIHLGSHPFGLVQTAHRGWPREGSLFLPRIVRLQTSQSHFDTQQTALCAFAALFGVSAPLAWLSYSLLQLFTQATNAALYHRFLR